MSFEPTTIVIGEDHKGRPVTLTQRTQVRYCRSALAPVPVRVFEVAVDGVDPVPYTSERMAKFYFDWLTEVRNVNCY